MPRKKAPKATAKIKPIIDPRVVASEMDSYEAKMVYKAYLRTVKYDVAFKNQIAKLKRRGYTDDTLKNIRSNQTRVKNQILNILEIYADQFLPSRWAKSLPNVGLRTAAALAVYVNINKCKNVSSLWRYAGMDPYSHFINKKKALAMIEDAKAEFPGAEPDDEVIVRYLAKRCHRSYISYLYACYGKDNTLGWNNLYRGIRKITWNPDFRLSMFRFGLVCRTNSGDPDFIYGQLYRKRKAYEIEMNEAGMYHELAEEHIRDRDYKKGTVPYSYYSNGMLCPGHLESRARRWAVKIFLTHYHQVAYYEKHGVLPKRPYILDVLGAEHEIKCPNWPFKTSHESAQNL